MLSGGEITSGAVSGALLLGSHKEKYSKLILKFTHAIVDYEKHEGTNDTEYCVGTRRGLLATELPLVASTHVSSCL